MCILLTIEKLRSKRTAVCEVENFYQGFSVFVTRLSTELVAEVANDPIQQRAALSVRIRECKLIEQDRSF